MNNMKMRKRIDPLLINIAVVESRRSKWKTAMFHIRKAFQIARQHGEYTDEGMVVASWIKSFIELHAFFIKRSFDNLCISTVLCGNIVKRVGKH